VTGARRWRWPTDHRSPGASLHAKLLVVDARRALVGSANLTRRALTANLEAGVLIEGPDLAAEFHAHVQKAHRRRDARGHRRTMSSFRLRTSGRRGRVHRHVRFRMIEERTRT